MGGGCGGKVGGGGCIVDELWTRLRGGVEEVGGGSSATFGGVETWWQGGLGGLGGRGSLVVEGKEKGMEAGAMQAR